MKKKTPVIFACRADTAGVFAVWLSTKWRILSDTPRYPVAWTACTITLDSRKRDDEISSPSVESVDFTNFLRDVLECFEDAQHSLRIGELLNKQTEIYEALEIEVPTSSC